MERDRVWGDLGIDLELARTLYAGDIASYDSIERAASTLARMLTWRDSREGLPPLH